MAKVIQDFTIKRRGREGEPFDEGLLDGRVHELKQGTDFKVGIPAFRQKASKAAADKKGRIESRVDKDKGLIQLKFVAGKK